jgi:hypothetical protein
VKKNKLLKEMKEDTSKWKNILCLWTGRFNIVKMSVLPKAIYTFTIIHFEITIYTCRDRKNILKVTWNLKGPQMVQTIFEKTHKAEGLTLPCSKTTLNKQFGISMKKDMLTNGIK